MNEKHIEAAASQAGVTYDEALAMIHAAKQLGQQNMAKQGKADVCDPPMGIDTPAKLPAWPDVLCDAEQLVRQKPIFSKYIKGTILENDVPVWIADFAQRAVMRERARTQADLQKALDTMRSLLLTRGGVADAATVRRHVEETIHLLQRGRTW